MRVLTLGPFNATNQAANTTICEFALGDELAVYSGDDKGDFEVTIYVYGTLTSGSLVLRSRTAENLNVSASHGPAAWTSLPQVVVNGRKYGNAMILRTNAISTYSDLYMTLVF